MTPEERLKKDIELINNFIGEEELVLHGNELRADMLYLIRRLARNIEYRKNFTCYRACIIRKDTISEL